MQLKPDHVETVLQGSFYGGKPHVVVKDAIFEASSPMRHMTEVIRMLGKFLEEDQDVPPIFGVYTDGGSDHRTTFISVQVAYIAMWLVCNLDMLVACRTPPYLSVLNPAERVMSTLNIPLYGLALARKRLSPEKEAVMSKFKTKKEFRKGATQVRVSMSMCQLDSIMVVSLFNVASCSDTIPCQIEILPSLSAETLKDCIDLIESRFRRIQYKGENISVLKAAPQSEIKDLWEVLERVSPDIDWKNSSRPGMITMENVMKDSRFKSFYSAHCKATLYSFQVCSLSCSFSVTGQYLALIRSRNVAMKVVVFANQFEFQEKILTN